LGLGEGNAGQAELGGFGEEIAGEVAGLVEFTGARFDFSFGEFANGFLQQRLFFGQGQVHVSGYFSAGENPLSLLAWGMGISQASYAPTEQNEIANSRVRGLLRHDLLRSRISRTRSATLGGFSQVELWSPRQHRTPRLGSLGAIDLQERSLSIDLDATRRAQI